MPLSSCTEVEKLIKTDPIEDYYDIGAELGRLANWATIYEFTTTSVY